MRVKNLWLLALAAVLASCGGKTLREEPLAPGVRFVAFGDAGTGSQEQIAVGKAMAEVCRVRRCDLALELGDNFYDRGVDGPDDPQFETAFEQPYAPLHDLRIPVYVVLGNHDNTSVVIPDPARDARAGDGGGNARGDYEVAYAKRTDRPSQMFRMPDRYYHFYLPQTQLGETPMAEFFALDSSPVAPYRDDPDQAHWNPEAYATREEAWLKRVLEASSARWKIVFAHHPYLSNGEHGNAGSYDANRDDPFKSKYAPGQLWKKLLDDTVCASGVDLYLSGHDHDLEWLAPAESCGRTEFIVSGAGEGGAKLRKLGQADRNVARWQSDQAGGFFWIELTRNRMRVAAFTLGEDGKLSLDSQARPWPVFEKTLPRAD